MPPSWLQKRLNDDFIKIVKTHIPRFLALLQKNKKGQKLSGIELLKQFLTYMGKQHRGFQDIPEETICTSKWTGMSQIYDMVRKKADRLIDEKPTSHMSRAAKTRGQQSPEKDQIKDKPKPKEDEAEDQEAVQMEAQGHYGGLEEREALYRQTLGSNAGYDSSIAIPAITKSVGSGNSKSVLGKRKFRDTKKQFIRLIDAYGEGELGTFTFKVQFWTNGINVTHEDVPHAEE